MSWKIQVGYSQIVPNQRGIVAVSDIAEGETVMVMGGRIVDIDEHNEIGAFAEFYGMDFCEDFSFCPRNEEEVDLMPQFLINHSCHPNVGFSDQLRITAIRDIIKGEEICYDYAFILFAHPENKFEFSIRCNCGQDVCRKNITVNDWKIRELQEKYNRWFMPFLREKFENQG